MASIGRSAGPHLRSVSFCHHLRSHPPPTARGQRPTVNGPSFSLFNLASIGSSSSLLLARCPSLFLSLFFSPSLPHSIYLSLSFARSHSSYYSLPRPILGPHPAVFFPSLCPPLTLASSSTGSSPSAAKLQRSQWRDERIGAERSVHAHRAAIYD